MHTCKFGICTYLYYIQDELQASKSEIRCLEVQKQRQCITIVDLRRESRVKESTLLFKEEEMQKTKETKQLLQV